MFVDTPEALENTIKIAERCRLELVLGKFIFPNFPIPAGQTADILLKRLTTEGLKKRNLTGDQDALERLEYELGVIAFKTFCKKLFVFCSFLL